MEESNLGAESTRKYLLTAQGAHLCLLFKRLGDLTWTRNLFKGEGHEQLRLDASPRLLTLESPKVLLNLNTLALVVIKSEAQISQVCYFIPFDFFAIT